MLNELSNLDNDALFDYYVSQSPMDHSNHQFTDTHVDGDTSGGHSDSGHVDYGN